jgi:hypothetical protein
MYQQPMPAPAVEEREDRRDRELDRPGNSVNGSRRQLAFEFNVDAEFPRTLAIAICRTSKWTDQWAASIDHIETAVARSVCSHGNSRIIGWQL